MLQTITSISKTFLVMQKNLKSFLFNGTLMSLRMEMVIFQENNPSFKWVVFATSWELLRGSHEKWIKNHTKTVSLEVFHTDCGLQLVKSQKIQWVFSKYILFSKQNKTVFWWEMATNVRNRYFHIDENVSSEC